MNDQHHGSETKSEPQDSGRRDFLSRAISALSLAFMAFVLYPVGKFLRQPPAAGGNIKRTVAGKASELLPDSGKIFRFGNSPGLVVRTAEGEIRAFSAECSHLNCTVQYVPGENHIHCACHDGRFDLNGQVISGPPPRPLERFQVIEQEDDIIVTRA